MGRSVNRAILLGNVGKDPEIRTAGSGVSIAQFSLATNERRKDAAGNWQNYTEWHTLIGFAQVADLIRDHVRKGQRLYIEGKLTTRTWEDRHGEKRYVTEIRVDTIVFTDPREKEADEEEAETAFNEFR